MTDPVADWLAYLAQKNRSPGTLKAYASSLARYHPAPLETTLEEAEAWWRGLDGLAVRTRARELASVRSFYHYAARYDLRADDPTRRLDPPSLPKGQPRYINRAQLDTLLADLPPDLRRAVCLGAWAGLRVSEAAALTWEDVDVDAHRIHIRHGKGNKSRAVGAAALLMDSLLPDTGGNVITAGGATYTPDALQRRINRAFKRAGVPATYHQLRHRFGTIAYGATGDILAVSKAMGHSSTAITEIYAAVSDDALDRVAAAAIR